MHGPTLVRRLHQGHSSVVVAAPAAAGGGGHAESPPRRRLDGSNTTADTTTATTAEETDKQNDKKLTKQRDKRAGGGEGNAAAAASTTTTTAPRALYDDDGEDEDEQEEQPDALFSPVLHFAADGGADAAEEQQSSSLSSSQSSSSSSNAGSKVGQSSTDGRRDADNDNDLSSSSSAAEESASESEEEEDVVEEFNPYLFIKQLPPHSLVAIPNKICLPKKSAGSPPISLVLDLDETLVHCTVEPIADPDMVFPVAFGGVEYQVHVRKRPYLEYFLESVSKHFEVVVFTASQKVYADELLNRIDPKGKYIKHRMFRESCLQVEGNFLKDLNVLGRDLRQAVLVDNSPHAFGYQIDNGIPIESWFDDRNDTELVKLETFLRTLIGKNDVRPIVRDKFKTFQLVRDS